MVGRRLEEVEVVVDLCRGSVRVREQQRPREITITVSSTCLKSTMRYKGRHKSVFEFFVFFRGQLLHSQRV